MKGATNTASSVFQRDLDLLQNMASEGIVVAIPAALHFCQKWRQPVPDWLLPAATDLLCSLLRGDGPKRRGRAAGHVARLRQDNIDYTRWSTVVWQREAQQDLREQVEAIRSRKENVPNEIREDRERLLAWLGSTLDRAFECSAMILEGTTAYGSPEAIKRSYFKVEAHKAKCKGSLRYMLLDPELLRALGVKWEPFVRPGRKLEPLYNLSL